jgi:hypothetical protein
MVPAAILSFSSICAGIRTEAKRRARNELIAGNKLQLPSSKGLVKTCPSSEWKSGIYGQYKHASETNIALSIDSLLFNV